MNTHPYIAQQVTEARLHEALAGAERSRLVAEARRSARQTRSAAPLRSQGGGCVAARPARPVTS
jgi:hypothetical protein